MPRLSISPMRMAKADVFMGNVTVPLGSIQHSKSIPTIFKLTRGNCIKAMLKSCTWKPVSFVVTVLPKQQRNVESVVSRGRRNEELCVSLRARFTTCRSCYSSQRRFPLHCRVLLCRGNVWRLTVSASQIILTRRWGKYHMPLSKQFIITSALTVTASPTCKIRS